MTTLRCRNCELADVEAIDLARDLARGLDRACGATVAFVHQVTLTSDNPDGTVQTFTGTDTVIGGKIMAARVTQTGTLGRVGDLGQGDGHHVARVNNGEFNLTPGQTSVGAVTFQVPIGVNVASVQWSGTGGLGGSVATWVVPTTSSSGAGAGAWATVSAYSQLLSRVLMRPCRIRAHTAERCSVEAGQPS